jgi:aspartate 1-decarboxylase
MTKYKITSAREIKCVCFHGVALGLPLPRGNFTIIVGCLNVPMDEVKTFKANLICFQAHLVFLL